MRYGDAVRRSFSQTISPRLVEMLPFFERLEKTAYFLLDCLRLCFEIARNYQ